MDEAGRKVDRAEGKRGRVNLPSKKDGAEAAVKALHEQELVHIDLDALKRASVDVRRGFDKKLEQVEERLDSVISRYPTPLIRLLTEDAVRIRVVASIEPEKTASGLILPGVAGRYDGSRRVITVTTEALHQDDGVFDEELLHAWDHLLGSRGRAGRLSEGNEAAFPALAEMGRTVRARFDSGEDFFDEYLKKNPREFLAHWVVEFGRQDGEGRKVLQEIGPAMYSVVESLLSEEFMRGALK